METPRVTRCLALESQMWDWSHSIRVVRKLAKRIGWERRRGGQNTKESAAGSQCILALGPIGANPDGPYSAPAANRAECRLRRGVPAITQHCRPVRQRIRDMEGTDQLVTLGARGRDVSQPGSATCAGFRRAGGRPPAVAHARTFLPSNSQNRLFECRRSFWEAGSRALFLGT